MSERSPRDGDYADSDNASVTAEAGRMMMNSDALTVDVDSRHSSASAAEAYQDSPSPVSLHVCLLTNTLLFC